MAGLHGWHTPLWTHLQGGKGGAASAALAALEAAEASADQLHPVDASRQPSQTSKGSSRNGSGGKTAAASQGGKAGGKAGARKGGKGSAAGGGAGAPAGVGIGSGVKLDDIHITFKNQQVLRGVSWDVKKGERVGLVGAFPSCMAFAPDLWKERTSRSMFDASIVHGSRNHK